MIKTFGHWVIGILLVIGIWSLVIPASTQAPPPEPVTGWFWTHGFGWISLNSKNCEQLNQDRDPDPCANAGVVYGTQMDPATGRLTGYGWSPNVGWMCVGETCPGLDPVTNAIPTARVDQTTGLVSGWARLTALPNNEGWIKLGGTLYRMNVDTTTRAWNGFGWGATTDQVGPGWVLASASGGSFGYPWLETRGGDVVGGRGVNFDRASPGARTNATYLIESVEGGTITNARSYCAEVDNPRVCGTRGLTLPAWIRAGGALGRTLPKASRNFVTSSGRIDFAGMLAGQYGSVVPDGSLPIAGPLAGKVYYYSSSKTFNGPAIEFTNGSGNVSGAGTVVIDGDLTIQTNLNYRAGTVSDVRQLASVAWVVRGDLIISPQVTSLVGTFIVLGRGSGGADPPSCAGNAPIAGCGRITTGTASANDNPLMVSGALIARRFDFQRTTRSLTSGAETIVADGRVLVNTPPGLVDIARGLPLWE